MLMLSPELDTAIKQTTQADKKKKHKHNTHVYIYIYMYIKSMLPNFKPKKTAIILALRGKGVQCVQREWFPARR